MLFWLKKTISFWLMPLPFCLGLIFVGLWLIWRNRRPRLGKAALILAAVLLLTFSNHAFSVWITGSLEKIYPPVAEISADFPPPADLAAARYIIVLGGGHTNSAQLPALSQLSDSGLGRLAEGVRLALALPKTTLLVSGPGIGNFPTHASILAKSAISLGISPDRIRQIDYAHDTEDEAAATAAIAGHARVIVVTSAWHMPRAAALFRKQGVDFIAAPTDYRAKRVDDFALGDYGWDSESLGRSTVAVHEFIGLLWSRLTGKISPT